MTSLLQHWVTEQAGRRPEAGALVFKGERLTYEALEVSSNRLAHLLKDAGCARGDRVCLLTPKSPAAIVGILGVLDAVFSGDTPGPPGMVLRYEALLENPREGLERILAHAGEPVTPESFAFLGDGWVDLGVDHTVAGNPMRFHQGRLDLRLDRAWTTKLPARDRKVVTAITWPLQLRYGYSKRKTHV